MPRKAFTPKQFFSLSNYQHSSLFNEDAFVWESLKQIEEYLNTLSLGKISVDIPQGAFLIDSHLISIGEGSSIEPGAYIKGPCYIGRNCSIRQGAYLRGNVITGDGCVIGHASEVKNSIFLDRSHAAHFAYVGDSILGNDVNLGSHTTCANLKLNREVVFVRDSGEKINTGLRKFGAIIGDRTQIGCNCVTNPGALIGSDVQCYPCLNVGGVIPSLAIVKRSSPFGVPNEGK